MKTYAGKISDIMNSLLKIPLDDRPGGSVFTFAVVSESEVEAAMIKELNSFCEGLFTGNFHKDQSQAERKTLEKLQEEFGTFLNGTSLTAEHQANITFAFSSFIQSRQGKEIQ